MTDFNEDEEQQFKVDYAASNRSTCASSKELIKQGELRVGVMVQSPKFDGKYPQWHKFAYFEDAWLPKNAGKLKSLSQISGLDKLKFDDVQKIKALIQSGDSSTKISKKEMTEEEKALEEESKVVWQMKEKIKANMEPREVKEALEELEQPFAGKIFGGVEKNIARLAESMVFGLLPKCPECPEGDLIFSRGRYRCTGHISEFARCTWETDEKLARKPFKCPKSIDNDFLRKFKYKKHEKVMASIAGEEPEEDTSSQPKPAASAAPVATPMDEDKEPDVVEKPFEKLTVAASGKLSKTMTELEKVIKENGGSFAKTVTKTTNILVANELEVDTNTSKVKQADKFGIPIVKEDWVWKSIELARKLNKMEVQPLCLKNAPEISAEDKKEAERLARKRKAAEIEAEKEKEKAVWEDGMTEEQFTSQPLKKKLKLKPGTRAAVEPDSGLDDVAHVLDVSKDELYNVMLNQADVTTGKNSFYMLQLLEADNKKHYWVFRKWGRIGRDDIGGKKLEEFKNLAAAKKVFTKMYLDKSGNDWSNRNSFVKQPGKMMQIEVDYGSDITTSSAAKTPYVGDLPKPTQDLIELIFDTGAMQRALMELEIDTKKMPLGKLSKKTIKEGYTALTAIQKLLQQDPSPTNLNTLLTHETNKFYNIIPHEFGGKAPSIIDCEDKLKDKIKVMDALLEMEISTSLLSTGTGDSGEHPIDTHYKKLKCNLDVVPKDSEEFKLIDKYVSSTHGPTHKSYKLTLEELWKMEREGEDERWKPFSTDHNRKLLWHGSRLTNWVGIISQGLRIAPPEAPSTGYMFGKGVYFADMVTKSSNYCMPSKEATTGLMALSEVALGKEYELTAAKYMDKPPAGYLSTTGLGKYEPDSSKNVTLPNGCVVPVGDPIDTGRSSSLLYNEFIVYNVAQLHMKYLLRVKFNYF